MHVSFLMYLGLIHSSEDRFLVNVSLKHLEGNVTNSTISVFMEPKGTSLFFHVLWFVR